ncbi:hypothetical protein BD779DRAFT_463813 [Infundibulicybe gibba]|nr:hypothetical protein BD779DRAFT_463813 [Infundibulicybe gibba]
MQLTLSESTPLNATYINEMGQAIYKVDTPDKFFKTPVATIHRIVPNGVQGRTSLRDQFGHLAQVEWHSLSSSKIRMGGQEIKTKDFFRKVGWGWTARNRVFTAPDGKEYKWKIGTSSTSLVANDSTGARVAKYRPKNYIINRRPASLEISPAGEHIMDMILVTFIYMEMIRKDEEKTTTAAGVAASTAAAA